MSAPGPAVALRPVDASELDAFVAIYVRYAAETLPYDPLGRAPASGAELRRVYADALDDEAAELLWIETGGERAGLLVLQRFDEADGGEAALEFAECYVEPEFRGAGVGRAAVEQVLARERARGTPVVDAAVLRDNPALGFWRALGFEVRAYRTARRP